MRLMLDKSSVLTVWAKSTCDEHGVVTGWLPLHQHLDDSGAIAELLVGHWLSPQVVNRIACELPDGVDGVRVLAKWLAAVHDVGKASPAFVVQVPVLTDHLRRNGLSVDPMLATDKQRGAVSHALVGHLAVRDWLVEHHGFARRGIAAQLGGIVGSHHGVTPRTASCSSCGADPTWPVDACGVKPVPTSSRGQRIRSAARPSWPVTRTSA
jgi:CRISPR-associated endonuclease Cas3-HD